MALRFGVVPMSWSCGAAVTTTPDQPEAVAFLAALQRHFLRGRRAPRVRGRERLPETARALRDFYRQAAYPSDVDRDATLAELEQWLVVQAQREADDLEGFGVNAILARSRERIVAAAAELGRPLDPPPLLGSARTGSTSARTYLPAGLRQAVVLVNVEFLVFALAHAGSVAATFPILRTHDRRTVFGTSPQAVEKHAAADPLSALRCVRQALTFAHGLPPDLLLVSPDLRYEPLARIFRDAVELFVVGHECAHVSCGHLHADTSMAGTSATVAEHNVVEYRWDQEYEADARGMELALRALRSSGTPPEIGIAGADIYFNGLLLRDQVSLLADDPSATVLDAARLRGTASPTHPPLRDRRDRLRDTVFRSFPTALRDAAARTYDTMDTMQAAMLVQAAGVAAASREAADAAARQARDAQGRAIEGESDRSGPR